MELINNIKAKFNSDFFYIFGSSLLNKVVNFLSSIFVVRVLTKIEYGEFTYAWNIYSIIIIFNGLGLDQGVLQLCSEYFKDKNLSNSIYKWALKYGKIFSIMLSIFLLSLGLFIKFRSKNINDLFLLLIILPFLQLIYNMKCSKMRADKKNKEFSIISTFNTICIFIFTFIGALIFKQKGLVIGYYLAYLSSIIFSFVKLESRNDTDKNNKLDGIIKKDLLKISVISMMNNGLSQLLYLIDVFIIGQIVLSEEVLASYKVSTMIPTALTFIPISLIIYVYPNFAANRNNPKWLLNKYKQLVIYIGSLNFIISFSLYVLSPFIINILFGNVYLDAVPIFKILSINYFFSGTFRIISGNLLVTQRELKFNFFVSLFSGVLTIVADYFMISNFGSIGAAYASLIVVIFSSVISTVYLIGIFRRKDNNERFEN